MECKEKESKIISICDKESKKIYIFDLKNVLAIEFQDNILNVYFSNAIQSITLESFERAISIYELILKKWSN